MTVNSELPLPVLILTHKLRNRVIEQLWWAPAVQPGSTHPRHQRLGVKSVTAFMGFFTWLWQRGFCLIPEACAPLSVPRDVIWWASQGDADTCSLQRCHLLCLFGQRMDKILCSSRDIWDNLHKIGISCMAREWSNVSKPSFPLCLPLWLFAKDFLSPFHSVSAAGHNICKSLLSLWSLGCSSCMRDSCFGLLSLRDWFPPSHQICPSVPLLAFDQLNVHVPILLACRLLGVLEMMTIGCNYVCSGLILMAGEWQDYCKPKGFWATRQCPLSSLSHSCEADRDYRSNHQFRWKDDSWSER